MIEPQHDRTPPTPEPHRQPPHEGDHLERSEPASESERELAETVRSISRLEESN